ncbi:hypothetical protein ACWCYY_03215 [Kitasatospora sp. NPDC001664]
MFGSRVLRAALVGSVGGAALLGAGWLTARADRSWCTADGWGCLNWIVLGVLGSVTVLSVLAGIALHLLDVRPAVRVVTTAPLVVWFVAAQTGRAELAPPWQLFPLLTGAAYAFVTPVVLPGRPPLAARVALVAALLPLWPLASALGDRRADQRRADYVATATVPLLGPDATGLRVSPPRVDSERRTLSYALHPDGAPANRDVEVTVSVAHPDFGPPYCRADGPAREPLSLACTALTDTTWRAVMQSSTVVLFVHRGDSMVTLTADGTHVTDETLAAMAASLAVRQPSYFG